MKDKQGHVETVCMCSNIHLITAVFHHLINIHILLPHPRCPSTLSPFFFLAHWSFSPPSIHPTLPFVCLFSPKPKIENPAVPISWYLPRIIALSSRSPISFPPPPDSFILCSVIFLSSFIHLSFISLFSSVFLTPSKPPLSSPLFSCV